MSIIVASDLTERSAQALARGANLATKLALPLHVVHAVDPDLAETVRKAAIQGAQDILARQCATLGVKAQVAAFVGRAGDAISRYATDTGGGLLVVGRHDEAKDGMFRFGETTAGRIVRGSPLPVLIVTRDAATPYTNAVVGVDFSIYARSAIRHGHRIAPDAALHLIHAYQIPFRMRLGTAEYLAEVEASAQREFDQFLADDMQQLISRAGLAALQPTGIRPECVQGMPYEVLMRAVERIRAELLVIGTHGAGGLARIVWGSVASALLENPPCDLLIVHES